MNKCAWCGKFRPWENLEFEIDYYMDMGGNVSEDEYFHCKKGTGCQK
jgi:hypothetical protein